VVITSETKIPEFWIIVHQGSIATATIAMADHMVDDFPNHEIHQVRACYQPGSAATPELPFISGRLLMGDFPIKVARLGVFSRNYVRVNLTLKFWMLLYLIASSLSAMAANERAEPVKQPVAARIQPKHSPIADNVGNVIVTYSDGTEDTWTLTGNAMMPKVGPTGYVGWLSVS
jgi:hypothetical protein